MIDRENRNKLAESCRHYWSCLIDNMEFSDVHFSIKSDDKAVSQIRHQLWFLYDDLRVHRNSGKWQMGDANEKLLKRVIFFLKSDVEYSWTHPSMIERISDYLRKLFLGATLKEDEKGDQEYWPFFSEEEYNEVLAHPKYLATSTKHNS